MNEIKATIRDQITPEDLALMTQKTRQYTRRRTITNLISIILFLLFIASFLIQVERYNYTTVPIEYTKITEGSEVSDDCYVDSLSWYLEAFSIVHYGTYSKTDIYYLVQDADGFQFLICAPKSYEIYLDSAMQSGSDDTRLYGKLEALPYNVQMDIRDYSMDDYSDVLEFYDAMEDDAEAFRDAVRDMHILRIDPHYPKTRTVPDGENIWYTIVNLSHTILILAFCLVKILQLIWKYAHKMALAGILEKYETQEEPVELTNLSNPAPAVAANGYAIWTCRHCGQQNSTQYTQCKRCGKYK